MSNTEIAIGVGAFLLGLLLLLIFCGNFGLSFCSQIEGLVSMQLFLIMGVSITLLHAILSLGILGIIGLGLNED